MVLVIALGSALFYAFASVLQHHSATQAPDEDFLHPRLLSKLFKKPIWVLGILSDVVGFGLQFWALGRGPLSEVQPLLVCGLIFALPMGAFAAKKGLSKKDVFGAILVVGGLSLFLAVARPSHGHAASSFSWIVTAVLAMVPVVVLVFIARSNIGIKNYKAQILAVAAGISYGFGAALVDACSHELSRFGFVTTLSTWKPYALLVIAVVTLLLAQSSFQQGPLSDSLPILTAVDPLVSIIIGGFLLRESIAHSWISIVAEIIGIVLMIAGIMTDGKSALVTGFNDRSK